MGSEQADCQAELLMLSARSPEALRTLAAQTGAHLSGDGAGLRLADVSYTLQRGRRRHAVRGAVVTCDLAEAARALQEDRWTHAGTGGQDPPAVAFILPGQGSQHPGMFADLYRDSAVFRRHARECSQAMAGYLGLSLADALFGLEGGSEPEPGAHDLTATQFAQPSLFLVATAAARMLQECGVQPAALLGHSLGELTAACLAGIFSPDDAARLVVARGRLMQQAEPGAMLAVPWPEHEVAAQLPDQLEIAVVNGPRLTVVSGPAAAIDHWAAVLAGQGVPGTKLRTSHAFHSTSMDSVMKPFTALVAECALKPPQIPVISNTTGSWLRTQEATDPDYWGRQLRAPVQYLGALRTLLGLPRLDVVADLGPGGGAGLPSPGVTPSMPGGSAAVTSIATRGARPGYLAVLGAAWARGLDVDPGPLEGGEARRKVSLPGYPFGRRRLWVDGRFTGPVNGAVPPVNGAPQPVNGAQREVSSRAEQSLPRNPLADWCWVPRWHPLPVADVPAAPAGNWLVLTARGSLGEPLAAAVRRAGGTARTLRADPAALRLPDCADAEDGPAAAMADVAALVTGPERLTDIAYLLPAECAGREPAEVAQRAAFQGLLLLAQTLTRDGAQSAVRVHVVTAGAQAVASGDVVIPEQAMALGPVRVLPLEYPGLTVRTVDVSPGDAQAEPGATAGRLLGALRSDGPAVTALRGGKRWEQRFAPADAGTSPRSALRREGAYVVTGGLGGIGLTIARLLTAQYGARVLLLGRRPAGDRQEMLDELNHDGAVVYYRTVDAADRAGLASVLASAEAEFGRIGGVFHCAGVAGAGLAAHKAEDDTRAVLGPKVAGTAALSAALSGLGHAPDFVLLCSSHNALLGRFGQVDYCAANAYMDAFAHAAAGLPTRWLSVNWDVWADVGMACETGLPEQLRQWRRETLAYAIRPREAEQAIRQVLAVDAPQVIVSTRDFREVAGRHTGEEERRFRRAVGRFRASKPVKAPSATPSGSGEAPGTALETQIARLWSEVLGVDGIGIHDDFLDLGGHSLLATVLLGRVSQEHGSRISLRTFLEHPTVAGLAAMIEAGSQPTPLPASPAVTAPPALSPVASVTTVVHDRLAEPDAPRDERDRPLAGEGGDGASPALTSLLFFSADAADPRGSAYTTLLTAARFADENDFHAVWLPERHFAGFGGLYPNPAVVAAALAMTTRRVRLRAGSVISPLHHPARIAEEWAVVDRLSDGRVDLSFGSGWHVNDFIFAPERYEGRKARMFEDIDLVARLWRGGRASFTNGAGAPTAVRVYPVPAQRHLAVWLTGESRDTFEQAGRRGANVLTAMMHQQPGELAENIAAYRQAREQGGHEPAAGCVTLMQHTFCTPHPDAVWGRVEAAFERYIAANLRLQGENMRGLGTGPGQNAAADVQVMAEHRLADLAGHRGLIGDVEHCAARMSDLRAMNVDEIACLVDFLPDDALVLDGLDGLRLAADKHRAHMLAGGPGR
jgi:phthiocerol/phenolphthiocerol synthesis type-I polyketide synthase E